MSQPPLILASGSPRRRQLLEEAGFEFRVLTARDGIEEAAECSSHDPARLVVELAICKLNDVIAQLREAVPKPTTPQLVLAADTVAECEGQILGKPRDSDDARAMMESLSDKLHRVFTGVVIARQSEQEYETVVAEPTVTTLRMDKLSADWIEEYVQSGAWQGKAGGFGYQDGLGFVHVTEGSESNVVGLPMELVTQELAQLGCFPTPSREA